MKQPWLKRLSSYLFEWHIESAPSELNPHLYVSLRKGRYQLNTANAVYSYEDRYDNFRLLFKDWNFEHFKPNRILVLGFGLGSVPLILQQYINSDTEVIGVEVDENVIYLASKYGLPKIDLNVSLITADARKYVEQDTSKYDLIISDVFVDDVIPDPFLTKEYLTRLKECLSEKGIIVYNTLAFNKTDRADSTAFYESQFIGVFPQAVLTDVAYNYMLVSNPEQIQRD